MNTLAEEKYMSGHIPSGEMRQFITQPLTKISRSDVLAALEQHGGNEQVGVAVTLLTRNWEALGSKLRGDKFQDLPGKCGAVLRSA